MLSVSWFTLRSRSASNEWTDCDAVSVRGSLSIFFQSQACGFLISLLFWSQPVSPARGPPGSNVHHKLTENEGSYYSCCYVDQNKVYKTVDTVWQRETKIKYVIVQVYAPTAKNIF